MRYFKTILFTLSILILLFIIQCGKSTGPQTTAPDNIDIIGQWQWVISEGGYVGLTLTPSSEGYNIVLDFDTDTNFIRTTTDTSGAENIFSGAYSIAFESTRTPSDSNYVIYMDSYAPSIFYLSGDSLFMGDVCNDCFICVYSRIE